MKRTATPEAKREKLSPTVTKGRPSNDLDPMMQDIIAFYGYYGVPMNGNRTSLVDFSLIPRES
ncbi:hypothetical protein EN828_28005 [Mesorhizobium sp. M2D.F.Ca.ET.185.01.1.1]|uniref:hypothetical protein n=1 Tax=unclassified Mesorhizobium TaxID=325217 RepID=UPI000FCCCB56|nr:MULTISPECIES: hypothetical protein [unclassified Mesorhizobium]TGP74239.1 hypothetical protein EN870_27655 [bacterium M00.F.Ca.ET.227.01.1.1]TGU04541.1 hypothetical protein EN806_39600 [bacterium M00.F.Ca.ET.163.01.1.1]TGU33882.1 hypothetical protein EN799_23270 [bacterium M00.F.Ca.ET.156.01.1.1]TGU43365.1 hypothetical protein EN789_28080 [bacterium M00.F.Ca.ET.146.01.1.1]TGV75866.1 hypothetical protein EN792_054225 [Mesorhizobium sp. M00.F.Ca.ET.149.01.1.1]TGW09036.1 hypothetical protein 